MPRIIILLQSLIVLCTGSIRAQDAPDRKLLELEHLVFICKNDTQKTRLCYEKFIVYIRSGVYTEEGLKELNRINANLLSDSIRNNYLWNASLYSYLSANFRLSAHYIEQYQKLSSDSGMQLNLLKLMVYSNSDTAQVNTILKQLQDTAEAACLSCLNAPLAYSKKGKMAYILASAMLPGSGMILNGSFLKGFTAMGLAGSMIFITYKAIEKSLYFNALGWGIAWGLKFYTGNLQLTRKLVEEKEMRKKTELASSCELRIKKLLEKYPLQFR